MKITYRPEIDGLRAIAVSAVILYHAQITIFGYQPFKGGFIGVDIFFVISGYLITSIVLKELVMTGYFSFKHFYERRVRRILPALLFVILASLPFAYIYLLPNSLVDFSKSILYSLAFSSNYHFYHSAKEYAVAGLRNPFLHTWSLSVEEQYYILFPIVLLITFKYFRKYLINILIIGFIISLGLAEYSIGNYPFATFYFLHTRMWELLAGSILAYFEITLGHRSKIKTLNLIFPFIGLVLIGYSIIFTNWMFHPSLYTLPTIIGVCLIIWFSDKNEFFTKILSTKLFVSIGLISYSLYLLHYPVFSFFVKTRFFDGGDGNILNKLIIVIVVFITSIISYNFIERPFRSKKVGFKIISLFIFFKILLIISFCIYIINLEFHPFFTKYNNEHKDFKSNYNYNNFDNRKNILIWGNSYADDLLNVFYYNKELNNKYYFYTALADNKGDNYQIDCFLDFLEKKQKVCENSSFSFLQTQYMSSDYIIFHAKLDVTYLKIDFEKIKKILKKDKKKFIVILDDLNNAEILDNYIYKKGKLPDLIDLNNLENKLFKLKTKNKKFDKLLEESENKLSKNNITFIKRSKLYCDFSNQKCPLIKNNNKIYSDYGHLTDNGAKYFSNKGELIIKKLLDN